jgi:hypothetical protein
MRTVDKDFSRVVLCTRCSSPETGTFVDEIDGPKATISGIILITAVKNLKGKNQYKFDAILGQGSTTKPDKVFANAISPLLDHFLKGGNATFISYGQKGLGKSEFLSSTKGGLIIESFRYILDSEAKDSYQLAILFVMHSSVLQVY